MRCEVVAIGTELLLGQIVDTNSSWIGEQLALVGIDSLYQTKVGDNRARMKQTIELALSRADAVICCGGLGPTQDDITREVIAEIMGVGLERDDAIAEKIREMFASRGRVMSENNLRQAELPAGAEAIKEMPGTAPGLVCPVGDKVIYAVPGVPSEMREMMEGTILPDLVRRSGVAGVIRSRVLRTWGHAESTVAEMLDTRLKELDEKPTATLAFQASGIDGIKVRITAKAASEAEAAAIIAEEEALVRGVLGDVVFGIDEQTMESVVCDMLRERGLTLAVAEVVSGGLLAQRMTTTPAADGVFLGSVVVNTDEAAHAVFGLHDGTLVDPEMAGAMAHGARVTLGADIGLAAVGVLGPEASNGHPPGTVYLGLAIGDDVGAELVRLPRDRRRIREFSVINLLDQLRRRLIHPA